VNGCARAGQLLTREYLDGRIRASTLTLYPEGVAEISQIYLRDTHILPKDLAMRNDSDVTGKPSADNP
jgi:hypothetical protein